nr:hypothetical protein MACL_00003342 [Theileria orientalis]
MGCMSSKLVEGSDLKREPNQKRTSKSIPEKVSGTNKPSETSKSKDKTKDKKATSGFGKTKSSEISKSKDKTKDKKTTSGSGTNKSTRGSSTKKSTSDKTGNTRSEGKKEGGKEKSSKLRDTSASRSATKDKSSRTKDKSTKQGNSKSRISGDKGHKSSSDKKSKSEARSNYAKSGSNIKKSASLRGPEGKTGGDKAAPKKKVINFIPPPRTNKPRVNSFDEKPISQAKNLSTKSWWEVEYTGHSSFKRDGGSPERFLNDGATLHKFPDQLSRGNGYGAGNVNGAYLAGDRDGLVDESNDDSHNAQRFQSKVTSRGENEKFKPVGDDFRNSTDCNVDGSVKIDVPFCDDEDDTPHGSRGGSRRGGFPDCSPLTKGAKARPFGFQGANDDTILSHSSFSRGDSSTSSLNGKRMDDEFGDSNALPSRSTNVPFRQSHQGEQDAEDGGPLVSANAPPRPKFKRPLPLKRGAGMIYRKATPLVKSPEVVIKALVDRIVSLEDSKFNEHSKAQKELIGQILKSPDVFARLDVQAVLKVARKIVEVAGGNRTSLARSSLICLGHLFRIFQGTLNPVVVDAMHLCAKKGVSSSPEHLVVASNFCMASICANSLEHKVGSMLVSLYRSSRAHHILSLSGMVVLVDRMREDMARLKCIDDIVDCAVKGTSTGGVPSRVASRNILGIIDTYSELDRHLNACRCPEITKVFIRQVLTKFSDDSKDAFVEEFSRIVPL